jgi:hypothetical protein
MAGYMTYCPFEGEAVHRMYQYPWVVRGLNRERRWGEDGRTWDTLTSFATQPEAETWLTRNRENYQRGKNGYVEFKIENWNE